MSNSSMNIHSVTGISVKPAFSLDTGARMQWITFKQADGSELEIAAFLQEDAPELVAAHPPVMSFFAVE